MKRALVLATLVLLAAVLPAMAQEASKVPAKPDSTAQADTAGGCPVETTEVPAADVKTGWQEKLAPLFEIAGITFLIVFSFLTLLIPVGVIVGAVVLCRSAVGHAWRARRQPVTLASVHQLEPHTEDDDDEADVHELEHIA